MWLRGRVGKGTPYKSHDGRRLCRCARDGPIPAILPRSPPLLPRLDLLQEFFKSVPKLQGRKFFVTGWVCAEGKRGLAAPARVLASLARFGGLVCQRSCT